MFKQWIKPAIILLVLLLLAWLLPSAPLDPWKLFRPKKIASIIFALSLIQFIGSIAMQILGTKTGSIVSGFFGGLISSTATTATLARHSKLLPNKTGLSESLTFLAATLAMLFEGVAILIFSANKFNPALLIIFAGPVALTTLLMVLIYKKVREKPVSIADSHLNILPILKLSAFIIAILAISKLLQNLLGHSGLMVLTYLVSLFEVHGSLIANIQLHDDGVFALEQLGTLLAISIAASYTSKLFLVFTLGSQLLKKRILKYTALLFLSLVVAWLLFLLGNFS